MPADLRTIANTLAERLSNASHARESPAEHPTARADRAAKWAAALRDVEQVIAMRAGGGTLDRFDAETQASLASLIETAGVQVQPNTDVIDVLHGVEATLAAERQQRERTQDGLAMAVEFVAGLRANWMQAEGEVAQRFVARTDALFASLGLDPDERPGVPE